MLNKLTTEKRNKRTMNLDALSTEEFLQIMNDEDAKVAQVVHEKIPVIAEAVSKVINAFQSKGRMIYIGAGTSGRIGLLDAVECPPTFGTGPEEVIGLIAGGRDAFIHAIEGAEDNKELAEKDLKEIRISDIDVVIGIAASGRTPYVIGGLEYANRVGAETIAISCNTGSEISKIAKTAIEVDCGPEVLSGSTRLKAGTAQKLICNMLSTASMVGIGKTYGNLLVDLQPTNEKLIDRSKRIVMEATSCEAGTAEKFLAEANNKPKVAIVMLLTGASHEEAVKRLENTNGFIHKTLT